MIWGIGEVLCFEAEPCTELVDMSSLAVDASIQEISAAELQAGLRGPNL